MIFSFVICTQCNTLTYTLIISNNISYICHAHIIINVNESNMKEKHMTINIKRTKL